MFTRTLNKGQIRKVIAEVSEYLMKKHGISKYYPQDQVDDAIKSLKLGNFDGVRIQDNSFAYGVFCTEEEYRQIYQQAGMDGDYEGVKLKIADTLYKGQSGRDMGHFIDTAVIKSRTLPASYDSNGE